MKSFWNFLWKTDFLPFNDNKKLRYMNYYIWYNFCVIWEWDRVILIKFINKNWFKNWILQRFVIWISNRIWIWNPDLKPDLNLKSRFQTGLESKNRILIQFWSEIWISNRFWIWKLDFKLDLNLKTGFQTGLESEIWISNRFWI